MISLTAYQGCCVGVFGLGKAGQAAVNALIAGGATVYAADDNEAGCEKLKVQKLDGVHVAPVQAWPWKQMDALVLSPGVPLTHPQPHAVVKLAQQADVPIIGDVELLFQACPDAIYVGITGTNGKSTTTSLIAHILEEAGRDVQVGGNLGDAAVTLEPLGKGGIYVIEMSSYQLDLLHETRFDVACFLNLTPDHLDRHGDLDGYVKAKMHIFDRQKSNDTAIIGLDDATMQKIGNDLRSITPANGVSVSAYGNEADIVVRDGRLIDGGHQFDLRAITSLQGAHNGQNAAVAYAAARACGLSAEEIYEAMCSYPGLRHRMQLVGELDGVRFINDSKATNADATQHALRAFDEIYWILGGKPKAGGIESLKPLFSRIRHAYLIGEAQEAFSDTLAHVLHSKCDTLEVAVKRAAQDALNDKKSGAVVMLSPACASFDQWPSFEARGDAFCAQVEAMIESIAKGAAHAS
jgi:UDP-N-acetylmuramoylalanine--D-glutamate ligase